MSISSATFIKSESKVDTKDFSPNKEFAFIGRSNVGKSSLINCITGNAKLAKVSATPGKTRLINKFSINNGAWVLVDLPGYGYAKASKKDKEELRKIIYSYILKSNQLFLLCLLIDIRHDPLKADEEFIQFLGMNGVPFVIVFTKSDKLSKTAMSASVEKYKRHLLETWEELPPVFVTSSETGMGTNQLIDYIESLLAGDIK